MKFKNYSKTDAYYEFIGENDEKIIYPLDSIIVVDDLSGAISFKTVASRKTIGYYIK